jgi:hypothetical protein
MWRTEVEILYVVGMVDQISLMILAVVIATTGRVFKPAAGTKNVDSQYRKITKVTKTGVFYIGDQNVCCAPNRRGFAFGGRKTA